MTDLVKIGLYVTILSTNKDCLLLLYVQQAVIQANIISPLVHLLQHAEFEIKKEAAWAISNATSVGSRAQIQYLLSPRP